MSGKPIDGVVQALIEVAVGKVQHLYRGTCPDAIEGFDSRDPQCPACQVLTAAQQGQAVAECHCATCTCAPGMTPAVRFDTSPAAQEGAIRDHLIALGWTPPEAQQPAARPPKPTECMNGCPDRQVCDHCQWPPGPDQQHAAVDRARFRKAPCYLCGYNGPGYFQPETHPCAALYHAAQHQEPKP